ncbi:MAG TPA: Xaa-Pro aminopeptidase [Longimicrobium sp.]|nr:Xaa-Pro aminopeptidase [Longimicrobium sp.]
MKTRLPSAALALMLAGAGALHAQAPVPPPRASADAWTVPATPPPAPISREEHARRRAALLARVPDGVLVVLGADEPEADYMTFAQSSPFRYLTGVVEPGAALVVEKSGGRVRETLFVLPRNPAQEVWQGTRLGAERATALTGIPARTRDGMEAMLDSALARTPSLLLVSPLTGDGSATEWLRPDQELAAALAAKHAGVEPRWVDDELFAIRAVKSPAELALLRRAILITVLAQRAAMRAVEPGMNEFEVHALIEGTFRRNGAERPGFGSIVGSGPNSTTLHYRAADRFMEAGETLVMDVGASYRGYSADVTRTVPVGGRFTPEQRAVYEIVLAAQKAAEAEARPGATLGGISQTADRVIATGLARLGLIEAPDATFDLAGGGTSPQHRMFYMHGLGHGIGLDVHDPEPAYPAYGGRFVVGSAFTIEPGIYVRADALDHLADTPRNRAMIAKLRPVVQRYRNIGVRIEDDYFITEGGVERVSEGAPREIAEIEALMARPSEWNAERREGVVEWYRGTGPR